MSPERLGLIFAPLHEHNLLQTLRHDFLTWSLYLSPEVGQPNEYTYCFKPLKVQLL